MAKYLIKEKGIRNEGKLLSIVLVGTMGAALLAGCECGFINGFLTAYVGLPEFFLTMGTMSIFRGFDYVYTNCQTIRGLDQKWIDFWNSGIPWSAIIMIALAVVAYIVIKFTKYGRYVFAVGALILSVLSNGLTLLRVSSYYQTIFTGVIIVVAILIDRFSNKD